MIKPRVHTFNVIKIFYAFKISFFSRYLGTGDTFTSLALCFAKGISTVSDILAETIEAIWTILQSQYVHTFHQMGNQVEKYIQPFLRSLEYE